MRPFHAALLLTLLLASSIALAQPSGPAIQLYRGWNTISADGNINDLLGTCQLDTTSRGRVVWYYNPRTLGWDNPIVLEPTKGYFIKVVDNCQMLYSSKPKPMASVETTFAEGTIVQNPVDSQGDVGRNPAIWVADSETAYVVYHEIVYPSGAVNLKMAKTVDGGRTWTKSVVASGPDSSTLPAIDGLDANRVSVVYREGGTLKISKTANGGQSWSATVLDSRYQNNVQTYTALRVVDTNNIYVAYWDNEGLPSPQGGGSPYLLKVLKSTDAGASWKEFSLVANDVNNNNPATTVSLDAIDANTVYVGYAKFEGAYQPPMQLRAARTTDGGSSWQTVVIDTGDDRKSFDHVSLDAVNRDVIYMSYSLWPSGTVLVTKSTDGGRTWTPLKVADGSLGRTSLQAVDSNTLYLSYYGKDQAVRVAKSVNGGGSWSSQVVDPASSRADPSASLSFAGAGYLAYYDWASADLKVFKSRNIQSVGE